jgi:putative transcription factor
MTTYYPTEQDDFTLHNVTCKCGRRSFTFALTVLPPIRNLQAKIEGSITSERRFGTAENKSAHSAVGSNLKKLEDSTEDFKHAVIDKSLSKAITATRLAKKMTQADLARLINERPQIIQEYEAGKAIPNGAILSKLDKALGTHLPRGKK